MPIKGTRCESEAVPAAVNSMLSLMPQNHCLYDGKVTLSKSEPEDLLSQNFEQSCISGLKTNLSPSNYFILIK